MEKLYYLGYSLSEIIPIRGRKMLNTSEKNEKIQETRELKRSLSARHLNMIDMGGSIGTGIFLALGDTIK